MHTISVCVNAYVMNSADILNRNLSLRHIRHLLSSSSKSSLLLLLQAIKVEEKSWKKKNNNKNKNTTKHRGIESKTRRDNELELVNECLSLSHLILSLFFSIIVYSWSYMQVEL